MESFKGFGRLSRDLDRSEKTWRAYIVQHVTKRFSFGIFRHDEEFAAVYRTGLVDARDARVKERGGLARLLQELFAEITRDAENGDAAKYAGLQLAGKIYLAFETGFDQQL